MESLSTKIDSALVEYMSEMDVYQTHLENLKNCFKEGFFHLGQAKYIMGASQLSQISYDSRMSASAVVAKPEVQQDDSETVTDLALALEFLEISRLQKKPKPAQDEEATEGNIRRRHKDTTSEKPTTDEEEKEPQPEESKIPSSKEKVDEDSVEEDVAPIRDPATWFGFLTPPALRETQTQFKRGMYRILQCLLKVFS
ncbi:hypothetical protein K7432_000574 [Basidiobolus ranarum]|uniref:Vacuolar ATPase assembly protein VMA22 n=1 Tax=Basidiobolus ranarum TaxID=34480 RepID=A0ABR2WB18_9FUNG